MAVCILKLQIRVCKFKRERAREEKTYLCVCVGSSLYILSYHVYTSIIFFYITSYTFLYSIMQFFFLLFIIICQIENNTPCVYAIGFIVTMDIALPTIQFIRVRMVFLLFKNNFYPILCFVLKRSVYIGKGKLELLKKILILIPAGQP